MKSLFTLFTLCFCIGALPLSGQEVESLEIINDNTFEKVIHYWNANGKGFTLAKVPGGRSGSCMRVAHNGTRRAALYSRTLIGVNRQQDTCKMSLWVKGKGTFRLGAYLYKANKRNVSGWMSKPVTVDSPSAWIRKDFTIKAAVFHKLTAYMRIAMEMPQGKECDLYFDDFSGVKESVLKPVE